MNRYHVAPRKTAWSTLVFDIIDSHDGSPCFKMAGYPDRIEAETRCKTLNDARQVFRAAFTGSHVPEGWRVIS